MKSLCPIWKTILIFTISPAVVGVGCVFVMLINASLNKDIYLFDGINSFVELIGLILSLFFFVFLVTLFFYCIPAFILGCLAAIFISLQINKYIGFFVISVFSGFVSVFYTDLFVNNSDGYGFKGSVVNQGMFTDKNVFIFLCGVIASIASLLLIYRRIRLKIIKEALLNK